MKTISKYSKLKVDFSAIFFTKVDKYLQFLLKMLTTIIVYCNCKMRKIKIGYACNFYGVPTMQRLYLSEITIGNKCRFRSDTTSNLAGINRKCIIATTKEKAKIIIGNNSGFSGTVICAAQKIIIGNDVLCGANVFITDFDWHPIDPQQRHTSEGIKSAPVVIEDNVWLGINTVVLKGVKIGKNSVVGANSLVIKDIPPNVIAGGNPCNVIKNLGSPSN